MLIIKAQVTINQVCCYSLCILFSINVMYGQNLPNDVILGRYKNIGQNYRISSQHVSKHSGVLHTYYVQTLNGLDIINAVTSLHIKDKLIVKENNALEPRFFNYAIPSVPSFNAIDALRSYASAKQIDIVEKTTVESNEGRSNDVRLINLSISKDPIPTQLCYVIIEGELKLIYRMQVWREHKLTDVWMDAQEGGILQETNMTSNCGFEHNNDQDHLCATRSTPKVEQNSIHSIPPVQSVLSLLPSIQSAPTSLASNQSLSESMTGLVGSYNVLPLGLENPLYGNRQIVVNPDDANASPYGWHDTNGILGSEFTNTQGNNVDVKEDLLGNNEGGVGLRAEGGSSLSFNFPWNDTTSTIASVREASTTNLFYWNNIVHDISYQYGFDEAAGNFQSNNYGKGGIANDAVYADDLDGGGINNADFTTYNDGIRPRMQMYEWFTTGNIILQPNNLSGSKSNGVADFGPEFYSILDTLVMASPNKGCTTIINNVMGRIVLIERGSCQFSEKVYNAQLAGASGVMIVDSTGGSPFQMSAGINANSVNIPSQMISMLDGNAIKSALSNNVTVVGSMAVKLTNSSMDNGVVIHEYAHGISNRLTGGAGNSSCLNNKEQMGEGWSDWLALVLSMKASDSSAKPRGIGNYLTGDDTLGRGIRTYRYTTDMAINPFTYSSINFSTSSHYIGSVWATMIWDLTRVLTDKYGYDNDLYHGTGGNNIAMQLIIEAMKLQPCRPGFVDGRDAILLADQLIYNGANQCLIWKSFARRGLGYSADQGSWDNSEDGVEAFDIPASCNDLALSITSDRPAAANNDSIAFKITIINKGTSAITNIVIKDTLSSQYEILTVSHSGVIQDSIVTFPSFNLLVNDSTHRYIYTKLIDSARILSLIVDNVELDNEMFTSRNTTIYYPPFIKTNTSPHAGSNHWFAKDDTSRVEKYLILSEPIVPTTSTQLSFWHKFDTEPGWDGGLVQYSLDDKTWLDLGSRMTHGGYNSRIDDNPATPAFSGSSAYINTFVNLGDFANKLLHIRFWMHCDPFVGGDGWYIDNITISATKNIVNNSACQTNNVTTASCAKVQSPIRAVPCFEVYLSNDMTQGSLRRAINCSNDMDTVHIVDGLIIPQLNVEGATLQVNKNIIIGAWDQVMNIISSQPGSAFEILPNKNILMRNLTITKQNGTSSVAIKNGGNLTIENVKTTHN